MAPLLVLWKAKHNDTQPLVHDIKIGCKIKQKTLALFALKNQDVSSRFLRRSTNPVAI